MKENLVVLIFCFRFISKENSVLHKSDKRYYLFSSNDMLTKTLKDPYGNEIK